MSCYFFRIGVFLRTELGREVSKEELKIHCCGDDRMQGFFKFFKIKMERQNHRGSGSRFVGHEVCLLNSISS